MFTLETPDRTWYVETANMRELNEWMESYVDMYIVIEVIVFSSLFGQQIRHSLPPVSVSPIQSR